jgi:hypothetical protein
VITIEEGDYVLGIWVCGCDTSDVMTVIKRQPGQRWQVHSRIRHYVDDELWEGSADPKLFYTWTLDPRFSDDELIETGRGICDMAEDLSLGNEKQEAIIKSADEHVLLAALRRMNDMHAQVRTIQ